MRVLDTTGRAFSSLLSPSSWPIMIGAVIASAFVVGLLWLVASWLIGWMVGGISWDWLTGVLQGAAAFALAWGLFPLLIPVFISVFVNQLAASIDKREYGDKPQGKNLPFMPELKMDLGFTVYALIINILLLPVYLIPGVNLIAYYVINAYLLGKQYFMMISRRHMDTDERKSLTKKHRSRIYICGLILVLVTTIPGLNLVGPAFAAAMMVHLFQVVRK